MNIEVTFEFPDVEDAETIKKFRDFKELVKIYEVLDERNREQILFFARRIYTGAKLWQNKNA